LAAAHAALGGVLLWYDWNWTGADREIKRAMQLQPESVDALTASEVYLTLVLGRADEAARTSQRLLDVDPLHPFARVQPGGSRCSLGALMKQSRKPKRWLSCRPTT
jgi:serine/threonine-protein kinase